MIYSWMTFSFQYRYLLWVLKEAPGLSQTDADWAKQMIPALAPNDCHVTKK